MPKCRMYVDPGSPLFNQVVRNAPVLAPRHQALVGRDVRDASLASMTGIPHHEDEGEQDKEARIFESTAQECGSSGLHQPDTEDTFYRTSAKVAPHNVLVKAPELIDQHLDLPAPERQFSYAPSVEESTAVVAGSAMTSINPRFSGFSSPTWEWDGTQGTFLRFQTNGAADSASSGNQIFATNVVVLQVGIDVVEDIPTTRLVNQGTGWVATGGSIVEINWFKATPESPIVLTTADGDEVLLGVGNTWVELIPNESSDVEAGVLTIN